MTAKERKIQIVKLLKSCAWSITMLEIGQGVGLKKTPYLKRLLFELCQPDELGPALVLSDWVREPRGYTQYFWFNQEWKEKIES